ncbi:MAG TPA: type II toxin-antitoxin system Phd/YefM family antitoxin [bacterium]|nr:type II toxin-antitoxin system Phd/YefM family antitoxin [bacterium]
MTTYTYSKARQNFSNILEMAQKKGEIFIRRKDGSLFVLKPYCKSGSPLDVPGVDISITREEITGYLKEARER